MKYIESNWRRTAAPIIAAVLKQYPERGPEQEKALKEAYPFGVRRYHPYKIWLSEIKAQRGGRKVVITEDGKKLKFGSRVDPYGEGA